MYIDVKDLPATLQVALRALGYGRSNINVSASDTYCMAASGGGTGLRAFVCAVDLATGKRETVFGSWGGSNMFNPTNAVDLDREQRPLPPNFAVIHGTEGEMVRATVNVNPATLNPLLPKQTEEMSHLDRAVLSMYAGLNSGGRKNQIERWVLDARQYAGILSDGSRSREKIPDDAAGRGEWARARVAAREAGENACKKLIAEATDRLVAAGLVTKNKAGAISVTTTGRNVYGGRHETSPGGYGWWPGKPDKPELKEPSAPELPEEGGPRDGEA